MRDCTATCPTGTFRKVTEADKEPLKQQRLDPESDWMIESEGVLVATGGVACHYNPPYGDIYMGVSEAHRGRVAGRGARSSPCTRQ